MANNRKQYRAIKTSLLKAGWRERGKQKNHNKLICPCGEHMLVFPKSSSDWRGLKNLSATLRRYDTEGCSGAIEV